MAFKGILPEILDEIRGWKLSTQVAREFSLRLADDLEHRLPSDIPVNERGMFHRIQVQDAEHSEHFYVFSVRLCRNDMHFWVAECFGVGIDKTGHIFWSSQS